LAFLIGGLSIGGYPVETVLLTHSAMARVAGEGASLIGRAERGRPTLV